MSDVNKLDSKKCSFSPDQYKYKKIIDIEVDDVAPVGSFPWAVIQVYLNKPVRRSDWDSNIYLMPKYDNSGSVIYLQWLDKDGNILPWTPEQEDMVACDWGLSEFKIKPDDCMLEFDIRVGTGVFIDVDGAQSVGYLSNEQFSNEGEHAFGNLIKTQNKTDIKEVLIFYWQSNFNAIRWEVSSDNSQEGYQKMVKLFGKNLIVTINEVSYHLGIGKEIHLYGEKKYEYACHYTNDDAKKLGALLTQNIKNTLRICCSWK